MDDQSDTTRVLQGFRAIIAALCPCPESPLGTFDLAPRSAVTYFSSYKRETLDSSLSYLLPVMRPLLRQSSTIIKARRASLP